MLMTTETCSVVGYKSWGAEIWNCPTDSWKFRTEFRQTAANFW